MEASQSYLISLTDTVDFAPSDVVTEVIQNVRTIISTRRGTVPLNRDFGVSWEYIDRPLPVALMIFKAALIEAVQTWEPRAIVTEVTFGGNITSVMDGAVSPTVKIRIADTALSGVAQYKNRVGGRMESGIGTAGGSIDTAEIIDTALPQTGGKNAPDYTGVINQFAGRLSDIEKRIADIEQSDYSAIFMNGEGGVADRQMENGAQTDEQGSSGHVETIDQFSDRLSDIEKRVTDIEQSDYNAIFREGKTP